jgi:hypothetical protein
MQAMLIENVWKEKLQNQRDTKKKGAAICGIHTGMVMQGIAIFSYTTSDTVGSTHRSQYPRVSQFGCKASDEICERDKEGLVFQCGT